MSNFKSKSQKFNTSKTKNKPKVTKSSFPNQKFITKSIFSQRSTNKKSKNEATQTKQWKFGTKMVSHSVTQTDNNTNIQIQVEKTVTRIKEVIVQIAEKQYETEWSADGYENFNGVELVKSLFEAITELEYLTNGTPNYKLLPKNKAAWRKFKAEFRPKLATTWIGSVYDEVEPCILDVKVLFQVIQHYAREIQTEKTKRGLKKSRFRGHFYHTCYTFMLKLSLRNACEKNSVVP